MTRPLSALFYHNYNVSISQTVHSRFENIVVKTLYSENKAKRCFGPLVRVQSHQKALEFTKVWLHKEIPTQTHPTAGLELRQSPIQVLT